MTEDPRHWARVDELFAEALSLEAGEREAYLDRACGADEALRGEVVALLASVTAASDRIGDSADALFVPSGPLVDAPDAALPEGSIVGPYRVRRLVGRGGMGNVYAAVRDDGSLTRDVALKVVRQGAASPGLIRRLRREQRILAGLEHVGIARLYDAGMTKEGTPYLVMEFVDGVRIDTWVRDAGLDTRAILTVFDDVCDAVAFAHQRFVIHRDLKPANILVDAQRRARLLDFGIARLTDETDEETLTRPGQLVLTPEYASPEQARGEPATAAMDVYALGVLLHELLTGVRPEWQRMVMTQQSLVGVERAMRAPSAVAADATRARDLRGDLDQVILTALAPDPARRYATVQELRDDLRRVRDGYAIRARRPGIAERTWRAARRNPVLASAWSAAIVLGIAFLASVFVQNARVGRERDRATAARDSAAADRDRALATNRVLSSLFDAADPWNTRDGAPVTLGEALDRGVARVNRELAGQPAARAVLLTAIGKAYTGLARFDDAQAALDTARALQAADPASTADERAATLTALGLLASARGLTTAAESLHTSALQLRTDSIPRPRDSVVAPAAPAPDRRLAIALVNVGASHMDARRFDSARVYLDSGIAVLRAQRPMDSTALAEALNNRATLAMRGNDFPLAARLASEALGINRLVLGNDHPRVAGETANLAFLLDRTGRSAEAEPMVREALRVLGARVPAGHPTIRSARVLLGNILSRTGQLEEASGLIADVVRVERTLPEAQAGFSVTLDNYAGVLEKLGRHSDALATYREALEVARQTSGPENPGVAIMQGKVADMACRVDGPSEEVLRLFGESNQGLERIFPETHPFRVGGRGTRAMCLLRADRRTEGEPELVAAFDVARRGPPQLHGMARLFGNDLVALYTRFGDQQKASVVRAQVDSLTAPGSR
ncbi:MAG: serine/threonine protein kinase [Gemmatimonadetes bacterium]|nr:serine/threonine protein kinase [Gemmatimonadota bacterium]